MSEVVIIKTKEEYQHALKRVSIAQLCRDRMAIGYMDGVLNEVEHREDLMKGDVKKNVKYLQGLVARYNAWCRRCFGTEEGYESSIDAAVEYRKEIKQVLFWYVQAIKMVFDMMKMPDTDLMSRCAVCKDLLDMTALTNAMEMSSLPNADRYCRPKELPAAIGYMPLRDDILNGRPQPPSFTGYLTRQMGRLNQSILNAIGDGKTSYSVDVNNDDLERSFKVCTDRMAKAMANYSLIEKLASGMTAQEVKEEEKNKKNK